MLNTQHRPRRCFILAYNRHKWHHWLWRLLICDWIEYRKDQPSWMDMHPIEIESRLIESCFQCHLRYHRLSNSEWNVSYECSRLAWLSRNLYVSGLECWEIDEPRWPREASISTHRRCRARASEQCSKQITTTMWGTVKQNKNKWTNCQISGTPKKLNTLFSL